MNTATTQIVGLISIVSIVNLAGMAIAQTEKANLGTFEDDRIKIVLQDCTHKQAELICQAILTSKNGDRAIELSSDTIKLVDVDGNEYYPNNLRIANRTNPKKIQTELVENASFRTSITFSKVPTSVTKFALLQLPLGSSLNLVAKFRNLSLTATNDVAQTPKAKPQSSPVAVNNPANTNSNSNSEAAICPENTKVLYRAASSTRSLYICGSKKPTHYVSTPKDGKETTTVKLLSYDKNYFVAESGATRYVIVGSRFAITKSERVVAQEKIEILQPLVKTATNNPSNETPKKPSPQPKPKVTTTKKTQLK
jgi:hypothetical protein